MLTVDQGRLSTLNRRSLRSRAHVQGWLITARRYRPPSPAVAPAVTRGATPMPQRKTPHCFAQRGVETVREGTLLSVRRTGLLDLCLHSFQVETRPGLHRWEFDGGLRHLRHFLLHELEAPELEDEPVVVRQGTLRAARHAGALVRVEAQVGEDRPIDLDRAAEHAQRVTHAVARSPCRRGARARRAPPRSRAASRR